MTKNKMPVKSLVKVFFPERRTTLSYFNDQFPLKEGDRVFVEGSLAGFWGVVKEVSYTFKIKRSEYKKVIAVADMSISGEVFIAGDSMIAIDESVLPYEKVRTWFLPPVSEEEEYEISVDNSEEISLEELDKMKIAPIIRERGEMCFEEERVVYLEICDGKLRAIVQGSKPYEITAKFSDGKITELLCDCPFPGTCKHEYALLLFLKATLKSLETTFCKDYKWTYLAMMPKSLFYDFLLEDKKSGRIIFDF